ncbi:hypothetical protein CHLRE_17g746997v5 [Chlamydomonas reinhardtii]|uniref:alcohol dehydrogenase n=1 Tax=Chlamydomonas reinhardtii TaxID=3055 RepID=A8JI07_CHLRE|nr:uncharacterized protein CHLRE_17g746997v5 [Chlamydomonas reinhardtii]PNW71110.1 hypothetical protein CHLRE_17g746997v5 [Chlamydomonas reinhardtii]|eukprot:XP_001703585.1 dual function alcohol dehydrogenase / acetaldehyde dehydrogenase [Chlamydomonas reinhardtii]
MMSSSLVSGKRVAVPSAAKPCAAVPLPRVAGRRTAARVVCEAAPSGAAPASPKAEAAAPVAAAPATPHAEVKKERAPATDEALTELKALLKRAQTAQAQYSTYTQEQVDEIFRAAAEAANAARIPLAKMAVEETRMGVAEDKVVKNHFASEFIYNKYKHTKTCGVIEHDPAGGIQKVAEPVGVIAGIVPTTNPTSTAIFKSLLSLKTRNALVLCPHPRAAKSTIAAARIVRDAAVAAGAPPNIISWVETPSLPVSQALMQATEINLILATGGPAMVRAAYSSGNPSLGVGAGNTPALIDETADVAMAVSSILLSKTFDNGVICASEQSVVVVAKAYDAVRTEFVRRGAYFLTEDDKVKVRAGVVVDGKLNPNIVGQSIPKLAALFGIKVPQGTKVLIGEVEKIGPEEALSQEKLCPILAMYRAPDYDHGVKMACELIMYGGAGHTSVLYTNPLNNAHIQQYQSAVKTVRILINTPASQGAIGDLYNFHLDPSLTLGCGTWGSTSVSTNVGPQHLLNIKTVTARRENMLWFRVPPKIYFKGGCLEVALTDLRGKSRAFIVTDKPLFDMGYADKVTHILDSINVHHQVFYHVTPDPTLACIEAGLKEILEFKPDVIIALGGGSPMDAAKIMWLMYECPDTRFDGLAMRFMDIRKRVYEVPELGKKATMVCIPTTSGTGSEVTPFSVVTDERLGAKYPLADYALTPSMAIVDPQLVLNMPKKLTAWGGIDALTHALESYVSICATDYTKGLSREAISLLFKYLPRAYANGSNDYLAREKVHYAATIAGMAFANAFLGICHSMAHKLGAAYHVPHGLANAALISHVIRYNATDMPAKQAAFPQYEYPTAKQDYADLANMLGLGGNTVDEKVIKLIEAVEELKAKVDIPPTIKEIFNDPKVDADFLANVDALAEDAFDDQCTGANPRYPLMADLKQLYLDAHAAPILPVKTLEFFSKIN